MRYTNDNMTTSTDFHNVWAWARIVSSCCTVSHHHTHTHRGSSVESFTPSTWSYSCERFSSPCYSSLFPAQPATLLPFPPALEVRGLPEPAAHSAQRGYGLFWRVPLSPQVMSPAPTTSSRPQSSPYTELLDLPPLFSEKVDYDDAALEDMLHQAHRAHAYHSLREDLFVSLSSSSMSDRTGATRWR